MRNRPEYLEALFAIWHAGLVAVPVNARLHRDEIALHPRRQRDGGRRDRPRARRRRRRRRWSRPVSSGSGSPRRRRRRSSTAGRRTRPGCSTRAARPAAQGRDAHEPQPARDDPQLLRRHRPGEAAGRDPPGRAAVARRRALRAAPHRPRGGQRASGVDDGDEIAALLKRWPGMSFFAAPTMVKRLAGELARAPTCPT